MLVQAALQQFLGELITVHTVQVEAREAELAITIQYLLRGGGPVRIETFQRASGGAA